MTLRPEPPNAGRRDILAAGAGLAASLLAPRLPAARETGVRTEKVTASALQLTADGRTDMRAALSKAINSGVVVDGEGGAFAVRGNLEGGENFKGLVNARLIQLDPDGQNRRTLAVSNASDFVVENVSVRRGGTGREHPDRSMMGDNGGIFFSRCSRFSVRGLAVGGGGIGSGVAFLYCEDFVADDVSASDMRYRLDEHPSDDAIQGIWLARCSRFALRNAKAADIGGVDKRWAVFDNNRGLAVAGCSDFSVEDVDVRRVGQAVDFSGSGANERFRVIRGVTEDCYSWGFKFANSSVTGEVIDAVSRRCGIGGFVITGPGEASNPMTGDVRFLRCLAEDVVGSFPNASASYGFTIDARQIARSYPRGVTFEDCVARAGELHCCMRVGFRNDVTADMAGDRPNRAIRCRVEGPIEIPYIGF